MSFPRYKKYKPSGVEWLGDVPVHWEVIALKRIADVQTGVAKGEDNSSRNTITVPYLRVANVQDGYLDLETVATEIFRRGLSQPSPPSDTARHRVKLPLIGCGNPVAPAKELTADESAEVLLKQEVEWSHEAAGR